MWNDLTMQQKSEVMKMAIAQGLTDLDEIKNMYNTSTSNVEVTNNTYDYVPYSPTPKDVRYSYGGPLGNIYKRGGAARRKSDPNANNRAMWGKAKPFYDEMLSWGIEPVAALGILGNMAQESSFLPTASNGTHHGYIQNQTSIRDFIKKQYGGYGHKEQMQYIRDGLAGKLKGRNTSIGQQLQARFNAYTTAVKGVNDPARAAYLWESTYEKSGGQNNRARQNYANYFFQQARPFDVPSKYTPSQEITPFDHAKYMQVTPSKPLTAKQIEQGLKNAGVTGFRVTSGYRSKAQQGKFKTPANLSWHPKNAAIDIVPDGISFAQLQEQLSSPSVQNFFMGSGLGVLDETSKAVQHKTGATGAHYHIGPDRSARSNYSNWVKNYTPQINYAALNPQSAQEMLTAQWQAPVQQETTPLFTEDLTPTIVQEPVSTTPQPTFADFWNSVFPQQPDNSYAQQEPLIDLSRMYTRPRVELKSTPLIETPDLMADNNYLLFNKFDEGGPKLTQEDLDRNNWRWARREELLDNDPLINTLGDNDKWIVDSDGNLVPTSTINKWLNSYERQTPYQEQGDIANTREIELSQQHRRNEKFNNSLDKATMAVLSSPLIGILGAEVLPTIAPYLISTGKTTLGLGILGEDVLAGWHLYNGDDVSFNSLINENKNLYNNYIKPLPKAAYNLYKARTDPTMSARIMAGLWGIDDTASASVLSRVGNLKDIDISSYSQMNIPRLTTEPKYSENNPEYINFLKRHYFGSTPQNTFLLKRNLQEKEFLNNGWINGKDKDYGLVSKAVGSRNLPVYQTSQDMVSRDNLIPLFNTYNSPKFKNDFVSIPHGGTYPSAIYIGKDGKFYAKSWDLNDYGGIGGSTTGVLGSIGDLIGSPTVITTGFQEIDKDAIDYLRQTAYYTVPDIDNILDSYSK